MIDTWREWLYPLGFLAQIAFIWRFMQQWISSELQQKSVVNRSFWQFSLLGNLLLLAHAIMQAQFHVGIIQVCNAVISWRNLNLMQDRNAQIPLRKVIMMLIASLLAVCSLFVVQGYLLGEGISQLFRTPVWNGHSAASVNLFWHILGFLGLALFSSRFWVQWWYAEKNQKSELGLPFWWLSIIGGFLSVLYFGRIEDPVNAIGPALGLIPYLRNIMLIRRSTVG